MKVGSKGEAVKNLQVALRDLGFEVVPDGVYGPQTEAAVKWFQIDYHLEVDGIAGPKTLAALKAAKPTRKLPVLRSVADVVARAWLWTTKKAKYILGEGGRNPNNDTPLTPDKNGKLGSDCVGFVLWCLGIDRYQPELFTYYEGWMNTDSIIADAKTGVGGGLWELLDRPEVGCLVIFPSLRKNGKMTRMGHVGVVVDVPAEWPTDLASWSAKERKAMLQLVKVIDCNASVKRKLTGKAIGQITAADLWNKPDAVFVGWKGE